MLTPRASCIMPTADRPWFVARAVKYFLRQDEPDIELIVVDDGDEPVGELLPADPSVRYIRCGKAPLGTKRNIACEASRGAIIVHWDDDDWYSPSRVRRQIAPLRGVDADVSGVIALTFVDVLGRRAFRYSYPYPKKITAPWVAGQSLCYTRALWASGPFADVDYGEDDRFVHAHRNASFAVSTAPDLIVATIHPGNTTRKACVGLRWKEVTVRDVEAVLGGDWAEFADVP